jgi:hypothetical protein
VRQWPTLNPAKLTSPRRVQTPEGMRYCPIVLASNGRIRPDLVLVNGRPERHPEGAYYLEWREKGRWIQLSVGKDAQDAAARRQRKEAELNALNNGVPVLPENDDGHRSVAAAVTQFLEETELTKKPKTLAAYTTALNYFTESCRSSTCTRSSCTICLSSRASFVTRRSNRLVPFTTSSKRW